MNPAWTLMDSPSRYPSRARVKKIYGGSVHKCPSLEVGS